MTYILAILAAVLSAHTFIDILGIPKVIKKFYDYPPGKRLKPLDCTSCLSFWLCIAFLIMPEQAAIITLTLLGAAYIGGKIK